MDLYTLILIIFLLALFAFQFSVSNKRKKMTEQVQSNIKLGAHVVTFSGIVGTIDSINEDVIGIKTGSAVIDVKRGAVREAFPGAVAASKPATSVKKPVADKKPAVK
jgi:preprotein translocase YajC subunit